MKRSEIKTRIKKEPKPLSPKQEESVFSNNRYTRIIAGAGAGKTETLTRRIVYLLLYEEVDPASIVAFTFTEKAAQSMKSRIYQRMNQLGRNDIAKRLGETYIGTIHGFCFQILEDYFGYGNYKIFDENQEMAFLLRIGWSLGLSKFDGSYSKVCSIFKKSVGVCYNEMIDRKLIEKSSPDFYKSFVRFEELLDKYHYLTFDRLVFEAVKSLMNEPEKLNFIRHLIVDEFQDINYCQYRLIELMGAHATIFVVGDPRQSIFQWRGSNEGFFQDFCQNFSETKSVQIPENRRSVEKIVKISNCFSDAFSGVQYDHMDHTRKSDGDVVSLSFDKPQDEAEKIVSIIQNLVEKEKCNYADFGILLRSVRTSAEKFINEFKKRKIPYLIGGKIGLFKRDDTQAVGRFMVWLADDGFWIKNPYNWRSKIENDKLVDTGIDFWRKVVPFSLPDNLRDQLINWKKQVHNEEFKNFKEVYFSLLTLLGYQKLDPTDKNQATIMANLGRFSSLLSDFEVATRLGGRKVNWEGELKSLCWFINTHATHSYEEIPADDLRGVDAVQVYTVHQAKGLEWPVVFLPALVNQRFPSSFSGRQQEWYISRNIFDVQRYEGGTEDEKRLFYVAITRARDYLVMSYFNRINKSVSKSDFLNIFENVKEIDGNSFGLSYKSENQEESDDLITFSATEILDYLLCPHHYRLNQMWGYLQSTNPLIGYGDALHHCLRYAAELIKEKKMNPISAVVSSVDTMFHLPFANKFLREKVQSTAKNTLIHFAKKRDKDMKNIIETESRLEFPLQNATIIGKVDVILKDDKSFEIRDYKTSDNVITQQLSDLQLQLYTHGLRELGWNISKGTIAYLEQAEVNPVPIKNKDIQQSKIKAENIINNIKKKKFRPKATKFCSKCEYADICKWGKMDES